MNSKVEITEVILGFLSIIFIGSVIGCVLTLIYLLLGWEGIGFLATVLLWAGLSRL